MAAHDVIGHGSRHGRALSARHRRCGGRRCSRCRGHSGRLGHRGGGRGTFGLGHGILFNSGSKTTARRLPVNRAGVGRINHPFHRTTRIGGLTQVPCFHVDLGLHTALKHPRKVQRQTRRHGPAQEAQQLLRAGATLHIRAQRQVFAIPQNTVGQARQNGPRPDLKEQAHAALIKGLNPAGEIHRIGQVAGQLGAHAVGVVAIGRGGRVADHGQPGRGNGGSVQSTGQKVLGGRNAIGMEPTGHRQTFCRQTGLLQHGQNRLNRVGRSGNHGLFGRVHIGQRHTRIIGQRGGNRLRPRVHGGHRAKVITTGADDRIAARMGQMDQRIGIKRPRRVQGGVFTIGMANGGRGRQPHVPQQFVQRHRHRANRGLGHIRALQRLNLTGLFRLIQRRARVDQITQRAGRFFHQRDRGVFDHLAHLGEEHRQIARHARILRALTGEEERHLIGGERRFTGIERTHRVQLRQGLTALLDHINRAQDTGCGIAHGRGHNRETGTGTGVVLIRQSGGNIGRAHGCRRGRHGRRGGAQRVLQRALIGGGEQIELMRPVLAQGAAMLGQIAAVIFL